MVAVRRLGPRAVLVDWRLPRGHSPADSAAILGPTGVVLADLLPDHCRSS